jgi:hypothetical protein
MDAGRYGVSFLGPHRLSGACNPFCGSPLLFPRPVVCVVEAVCGWSSVWLEQRAVGAVCCEALPDLRGACWLLILFHAPFQTTLISRTQNSEPNHTRATTLLATIGWSGSGEACELSSFLPLSPCYSLFSFFLLLSPSFSLVLLVCPLSLSVFLFLLVCPLSSSLLPFPPRYFPFLLVTSLSSLFSSFKGKQIHFEFFRSSENRPQINVWQGKNKLPSG